MKILSIGSVAAELLEEPHTAVLQGITSKGLFLRLDNGWIIFLSQEAERGPLTLNVPDEMGDLNHLAIGAQFEIRNATSNAELNTGNGFLEIDSSQAQIWSAPPRPAETLLPAERVFSVAATIRQAQNLRPTASLTALQAVLDRFAHAPGADAGLIYPYLASIKDQLAGHQRPVTAAISSPLGQLDPHSFFALLGLGRGLTPAGDDILLGLLLALNRWRTLLAHSLNISWLNRSILAQAYQRTTTISANLIECAARGQADERLVAALDGIMTGSPGPEETARLLTSWGSSSGFDALCGMALGIS